MTKDEYIRASLSKIQHKPWELYVVSRIIHLLDDPDIEFVAQQLVRLPDGKRALTDLYFPQFDLHLEVNEGHHLGHDQAEADAKRESDIRFVTEHEIETIRVAELVKSQSASQQTTKKKAQDFPLVKVNVRIAEVIQILRTRKREALAKGSFESWDIATRYSPNKYIEAKSISRNGFVAVKHQRDALRCFGYPHDGGHYQRGIWNVPGPQNLAVWFPRLYAQDDWDNEIADSGRLIIERAKTPAGIERMARLLARNHSQPSRIVFARYKDPLGADIYRYVGTFDLDFVKSTPEEVLYNMIREGEETRPIGAVAS